MEISQNIPSKCFQLRKENIHISPNNFLRGVWKFPKKILLLKTCLADSPLILIFFILLLSEKIIEFLFKKLSFDSVTSFNPFFPSDTENFPQAA